MDIEVAHEAVPAEWDDLVRKDEAATFFHTSGWARALSASAGRFRPLFLLARTEGRLVAGIPALVSERAGFRIVSSMPFGTFGGPVVRPGAPAGAVAALVDAFRGEAAGLRTASAHLVDFASRLPDGIPGFETVEEEAQIVRLDRDYEELSSRFKPSARNKIRKALKAGVEVRRASSEGDFLAYHEMLAASERKWGVDSGFGAEFFTELARLEGDAVQMWIAEHDGRIIAGDLNFALHGMIMNWGNVSHESARRLAPNNLLHAVGIEEGLRAGCSTYNLGSSAGIKGVEAFKESFGTERVRFRWYRAEKTWYRAIKSRGSSRRRSSS